MVSAEEGGAVGTSFFPFQANKASGPTDSFHHQGPHGWLRWDPENGRSMSICIPEMGPAVTAA